MTTPQHGEFAKHDDSLIYLGRHNNFDLYLGVGMTSNTLIARYGNYIGDYYSAPVWLDLPNVDASDIIALRECLVRAAKLGLTTIGEPNA